MIKYVWLIMLIIIYIGWGIYAAYDLYLSHETKLPCEAVTMGFITFTLGIVFIYSFVSWLVSWLGSFQ